MGPGVAGQTAQRGPGPGLGWDAHTRCSLVSPQPERRYPRTLMGSLPAMHPLISMLGILTTLAVVLGIFILTYRYHDPRRR